MAYGLNGRIGVWGLKFQVGITDFHKMGGVWVFVAVYNSVLRDFWVGLLFWGRKFDFIDIDAFTINIGSDFIDLTQLLFASGVFSHWLGMLKVGRCFWRGFIIVGLWIFIKDVILFEFVFVDIENDFAFYF